MEIITVHTTQNIDIEYEVGGIGERMLAYGIDAGIFLAISIIAAIISTQLLSSEGVGAIFIVIGLTMLFYDLVCETFFNGQSFGKRVMKIRVISLDGSRPKFSQYLLRWLFRLIDFSLTSYLAGMVTIIVSKNGQRIGDLVAGTIIIRTVPRTSMDKIIYKSVEDGYQPVFPQVTQLKEEDIALIHEVIESYIKNGSTVPVYKAAERIREILAISLPPKMNSMQFLQTVLKDYSHVIAHMAEN